MAHLQEARARRAPQALVFGVSLAVVLGLAGALGAGPAFAQDAPGAGDPPPAAEPAAALAIKIDITETVDGKASKYMIASYFIRKKLREAGFRAWCTSKLPPDAKAHEKAVAAAKERGVEPPQALEDLKPAPALVITGTCEVRFDRQSTFYGAPLASVYASSAHFEIKDEAGKTLAQIDIGDEWGKEDKRRARNEALQRIGLFSAVDVLGSEPIQMRLTERGKAEVQEFIDKINGQRNQGG